MDGVKMESHSMEFKVFSDPVHRFMSFHPLLVVIIDTPQLQRLRNIKQLGPCYFVFPSASHSRFEHSLGTAFIAGKLFDSLRKKGIPTDESTWEKQKLCAQVAGLCHDVGHGPFSHMWEVFSKRYNEKWSHEKESTKIFDEILKENVSPSKKFGVDLKTVHDVFDFFQLTSDDIECIKNMILGSKRKKNYLYQVINNKNTGIDVDKWEYIARDSIMLNVPIGFDYVRLLDFCCIHKNENEEQICFRDKECSVLVEMFFARGKLHDTAYQHTKVRIIQEMLLDAFHLANERLQLSKTPVSQLTDHIYHKILFEDFGKDENMRKAKEILRRIENRHLYKCIAQENHEGQLPKWENIKKYLSPTPNIGPYIDHIEMTTVNVHMTKYHNMNNVVVCRKEGSQNFIIKTLKWSEHQTSLKIDLGKLKRNQVLLLYKGSNPFPKDLELSVVEKFKMALQHLINI